MFKVLRENKLYINTEKCSFAKKEVLFLEHKIKDDKLMMKECKVQAINPSKIGSCPQRYKS